MARQCRRTVILTKNLPGKRVCAMAPEILRCAQNDVLEDFAVSWRQSGSAVASRNAVC